MLKNLLLSAFSFVCLCLPNSIYGQSEPLWTSIEESAIDWDGAPKERVFTPQRYEVLELNIDRSSASLAAAPEEGSREVYTKTEIFEIPLPGGQVERFHIVSYSMMQPGLAVRYPDFKTFYGTGVDNPTKRIRLDWTGSGLNAMLFLPEGLAFLKPYAAGEQKALITKISTGQVVAAVVGIRARRFVKVLLTINFLHENKRGI